MSAVYFIRSPETQHYKVGCSRDPEQRLRDLQRYVPVELVMAAVLPVPSTSQRREMLGVERRFHERYLPFHHRGEWFSDNAIADHDIASIRSGSFDLATLPVELTEASLLRKVCRGPRTPATSPRRDRGDAR